MQYFNGLRDVREEALCFEEAQRKVSFHDSILRYKREEGFLNYSRGQGSGIISQGGKTSTVGATSDATTGQFADATAPVAPTTLSLEGMATLEDSEPLIGAIAPDTGTYKPTGNKFTRSHSPGTEDDESDNPPANSQGTAIGSPPDNKEQDDEDHLLTPDVHSGTLDLIMDQLISISQPELQLSRMPHSQLVLPVSSQLMSWLIHCKFYLHLLHLLWVPPPLLRKKTNC